MTQTFLADETWIVNQLMGIKVMEKEIGTAVAVGRDQAALRARVAALNSWLDLLDQALTTRPEPAMRRRPVSMHRRAVRN